VLCCVNARGRVADVRSADSKSGVVDTHTQLGIKIAPGVSGYRVCTEPGGTGFRQNAMVSEDYSKGVL
jgi:hypothetical protein